MISSPPGAWCIAVRASDTRLDAQCHATPETGNSHKLTLDAESLRRLCAPVQLPAPGLSIAQTARLLGAKRGGLLDARVKNRFGHDYILGPRGRRVPRLYSAEALDPGARLFARADPAWSITARDFPGRLSSALGAIRRQTLTRVPIYFDATQDFRDRSQLHSEHPAHEPPKKSRSKKLPPPPDYVWYKWKGDEYVGYDWRAAEKNPRIRENYERRQRVLAKARDAGKRRRQEDRPPRAIPAP